jgi:hypothetical protein
MDTSQSSFLITLRIPFQSIKGWDSYPTTHLHLGHVGMRSPLMPYRTSRKVQKIIDSVLGCAVCRHNNKTSNYLRTLKCTMPVPAAARLLRSWVRIPPEAWMSVCFECCVLSGRSPYEKLITRPEESYRLWCVVECDLETSCMRRSWPSGSCCDK